jgi:hypothetical protein
VILSMAVYTLLFTPSPDGLYDDPRCALLRTALYPRLRYHFQFSNEKRLFPEIYHHMVFSVNVYSAPRSTGFDHIAMLFEIGTLKECFDHQGNEPVGGIKNEKGNWNTAGHAHRIIAIDEKSLAVFAALYDESGTPALQARLPPLYARELVIALRKFANYTVHLKSLGKAYLPSEMWHETNAVRDGTIRRDTRFATSLAEWISSGPHISVANPYFKTPRTVCIEKSDYDPVDLTDITADYLPRTNYVPAVPDEEYFSRVPTVPWSNIPITDSFRLFFRRQLNQGNERTLRPAVLPPRVGHIDSCFGIAFESPIQLAAMAAAASSLVFDFFVKTTGKGDFRGDLAEQLPVLPPITSMRVRALLLNCLSSHYQELWSEAFDESFRFEQWTKEDCRLSAALFRTLTREWRSSTPLRTDFERRQALVEIDVLAAMELRLTLDELCTIYRIQFPVLRQNEQDTWYDRNGRIVFTSSKALPGVGFSRPEWEKIREMKSGTVTREVEDDTLPGGLRKRVITYEAPFDRCDREEDYKTAWAEFERRRAAVQGAEA